jgi:hypothetical protein
VRFSTDCAGAQAIPRTSATYAELYGRHRDDEVVAR